MSSFGSPFGSAFGNANTNNTQQSSGFAGFGATNNNTNAQNTNSTGGFGNPGSSTGFGAGNNNAGGTLFGGATASGTGFGGFGTTNNNNTTNPQQSSAFGQQRPFGAPATSAGSLFGGTTGTTGTSAFGGFGSTANNNNNASTTSAFAPNTSGGLFGGTTQSNTGFGGNTGSTGLFSGGANQSTGFGNNNTSTGFGQPASNAFGGGAAQTQNNGTGGTPFAAHSEKDTTQTSHFQSITCQPQYANFQFEELRAVDYNQGRRYGNQSGQAGAFGAPTGFGAFGTSTNNNANSGFGTNTGGSPFGVTQNQPQSFAPANNSNAFGATGTGSSLFAAKPQTTGGLFGTPTATSGQTGMFGGTGSAFGTNTNTTGFGGSGNTLFGQQNNQQKPASLFSSTNTSNNTFGTPQNTGTGFGGGNTGTSLFGGAQNNTQNNSAGFQLPQNGQQGGGLFGANQNQGQNNQQGGGIFGAPFGSSNQPKPNPFGGSTATSGGLFGTNNSLQQQPQQAQPTGGLFNTQNNQGTGLFGQSNQQPKPGLFSSSLTNNNNGTAGGLFGAPNNQNQQNQQNGIFNLNQGQKPGGLFGGSSTTTNTGSGGLFGLGQSTNNLQNNSSTLFGSNNQNTQPQMGSTLFGNTQQYQQQQQQPQQLTTSIAASNPYGNDHLFVSLATPPQAVGPLITPLSSSQKARKPAPLPTYRLNPAASSRLLTPQKRSGYGFDYSAYGTPGSAYSNATPPTYGRGGLFGSGSFGRTLGKSLSTSNLRSAYNPEESILAPGAFSAGGMGSGSGHMKKLKINRGLRTDLFGAEGPNEASRSSPLKKTVSFDQQTNGQASNALVHVDDSESPTPSAEEQGYIRSSRRQQQQQQPTTQANGNASSQPEMEQVKGNELAVVPEDTAPPPTATTTTKSSISADEMARLSQKDMDPGSYYMIPSKAEIEKMPRKDRSKISPFVVGRQHTGKIEFDQVDLSNIDLDKICGEIVQISQRSATVYPNHAAKPPEGKGMNFPARITLENSWPRSKGGKVPVFERKGPRFEKHIERLKRVDGTEFEQYVIDKGQWIFRVPHFSTYALDYSDDDETMLSPAPASMSMQSSAFISRLSGGPRVTQQDLSFSNSSERDSNVDDTFEFRMSKSLPGAFERDGTSDEEGEKTRDFEDLPASSASRRLETLQMGDSAQDFQPGSSLFDADLQIGSTFDGVIDDDSPQKHSQHLISPIKPKSILKTSQRPGPGIGSPSMRYANLGGDWASQLQRTLSPKKQNRQTLRESQGMFMRAQQQQQQQQQQIESTTSALSKETNPFATSIDVMNSLFGQSKGTRATRQTEQGKGFQYPYAKRNKHDPENEMTEADRAFHNSFKPSWAFDGTFIYSASGPDADDSNAKTRISFEGNDNEFGCFAAITPAEATDSLREQQSVSVIVMDEGCPRAHMSDNFELSSLAEAVTDEDPVSRHEKLMWHLASTLFDNILPKEQPGQERKKLLSTFWTALVQPGVREHLRIANQTEHSELALIQLSGHDIPNAVASLVEGKNFRLSTMIAQIGGNETMRSGFAAQIEEWRRTNALSEISPAIRALYELLAGNTAIANGNSKGGPENKAETFHIGSRFELDWRRSFGLKLWYGTLWEEDTLAETIKSYVKDLTALNEEVKPLPWFLEQDVHTGWDDPRRDERQDILLGLLQIFALKYASDTKDGDDGFMASKARLADIISPQNVSGNPTDARLSFQLYHSLSAKDIVNFPEAERDHKADLLATDYAFQLSADPENLFDALFVILHLTDASAREAAVKALLNRHAGAIEDSDSGELFSKLVSDLKIPRSWIWAAKALYAKAVVADQRQECYCLLKAGEKYLEQAHETLRKALAPKCIIEENTTTLREVLDWFSQVGAARMKGWDAGGGVYTDYLRLLELARHGDKNEAAELVKKLGNVLATLGKTQLSLEERVAITEMANGIRKAVDEVGWRTGGIESMNRAVQLPNMPPVASDAALKKAMELSENYYSSVAVG